MSNKAGTALKRWRLRQRPRLSQTAAAKLVGVEQPTWSRWETGVWRPEGSMRTTLKVLAGIEEPAWDTAGERAVLRRVKRHLASTSPKREAASA